MERPLARSRNRSSSHLADLWKSLLYPEVVSIVHVDDIGVNAFVTRGMKRLSSTRMTGILFLFQPCPSHPAPGYLPCGSIFTRTRSKRVRTLIDLFVRSTRLYFRLVIVLTVREKHQLFVSHTLRININRSHKFNCNGQNCFNSERQDFLLRDVSFE